MTWLTQLRPSRMSVRSSIFNLMVSLIQEIKRYRERIFRNRKVCSSALFVCFALFWKEDPCLLFVTNSTTVLLVNLGARRGPEGPGCHLIYNRCRYSLQ
jgi:hypothetical protein